MSMLLKKPIVFRETRYPPFDKAAAFIRNPQSTDPLHKWRILKLDKAFLKTIYPDLDTGTAAVKKANLNHANMDSDYVPSQTEEDDDVQEVLDDVPSKKVPVSSKVPAKSTVVSAEKPPKVPKPGFQQSRCGDVRSDYNK